MPTPAASRTAVALVLLGALSSADAGRAEPAVLFEDPIRVEYSVEVERNSNHGGYLAVSDGYDYRDGSFLVQARKVERGQQRTILGPEFAVSEKATRSGTRLSFSSRQSAYLAVFVARADKVPGHPRVEAPFGRILSADGAPLSRAFRISPDDDCSIGALYGVAYSPFTNRWLVAWSGSAVSNRVPNCERVRARFVSASGEPGSEVKVTRSKHLRSGGSLAYSEDLSEFLVVWSEGSDSHSIVGRVIREREARNSQRIVFAHEESGCVFFPQVAGSADAPRWLVAWQNRCGDVLAGSLESRVLEADGRLRRARTLRSGDVVMMGDITFNEASGRFLGVWEEAAWVDHPETPGAQRGVFSRSFRKRGRALGADLAVGLRPYESHEQPRTSCSVKRAECFVVWLRDNAAVGEFVALQKTR